MKGEELQGRVKNYDNSRVPSGIELNMNAKRVKKDGVLSEYIYDEGNIQWNLLSGNMNMD
jgi:hypothetical protein